MFRNTTGGDYQDNGVKAFYTFPKGAVFEINDVSIPLEGMTVDCYGGQFDGGSIEHFTKVSSLLHPQKEGTDNTAIFINDNDISGRGYPLRDEFLKYGIDYLSAMEFNNYKNKICNEDLPTDKLRKIINFFQEWAAGNRTKISDEIQKIVGKNNRFPKNLSMIYDDRLLKHTTHIVLSFETPNRCILHVDNTLSPLFTFFSAYLPLIVNQLKIDADECPEKIADDQSRFVELYKNKDCNEESPTKLELSLPVNQIFIAECYKRMKEMLGKLGLEIRDVKIHHSFYNQKMTDECVTYAIQNKLDYVTGNHEKSNETVRQNGIRLRAEHAVLSYLLSGNIFIHRYNDQHAGDFGFKYDETSWYPNYTDVCKKLDDEIKRLSFDDLNKLYLSTEIDDTTKLSTRFVDLILSAMKDKLPNDEYKQIASSDFSQERAIFMEKIMAPGIFYNKEKQSLFIAKSLMFSLEKIVQEEKCTKHAVENDIEQELRI
jgi:hypothetical protein